MDRLSDLDDAHDLAKSPSLFGNCPKCEALLQKDFAERLDIRVSGKYQVGNPARIQVHAQFRRKPYQRLEVWSREKGMLGHRHWFPLEKRGIPRHHVKAAMGKGIEKVTV